MKKNSLYAAGTLVLGTAIPLFASAATGFGRTTDLLGGLRGVVGSLTLILIGVALLVFVWGIVKYIASAGDEGKAKEGKSIMIYGVIALFVLFSVFGLIKFLQDELLGTTIPPSMAPPQVKNP